MPPPQPLKPILSNLVPIKAHPLSPLSGIILIILTLAVLLQFMLVVIDAGDLTGPHYALLRASSKTATLFELPALIAYILSRTGRDETAAWITVLLMSTNPFITLLMSGADNGQFWHYHNVYLLLSVMLATLLLDLRAAVAVVLANTLGIGLLVTIIPSPYHDPHSLLIAIPSTLIMSLFAIWPAFNLRDKLQAATQELFEAAEANNRLAILEERHRIAHELHDTVSQTLFGANLIAEGIQTTLTSDPEQAYHKLDEFRHATSSALAGMRLMLVELHPRGIMEAPLDLTIIQLTQTSWGRTGIEIATEISGPSTIYPGDVQLALYRITQQAITNAIQHAAATQITVRLEQQHNTLALTIEDNGVGFAPGLIKPGRFGVPTMECRARSVGAALVIDSAPGSGTRIIATWKGACVDEDKSAGG